MQKVGKFLSLSRGKKTATTTTTTTFHQIKLPNLWLWPPSLVLYCSMSLSTWAAGTRRTRSVKPSTISWLKGVRLQETKQGKFHGFGPHIWGYIYIILYIIILYMYDVYMFLISKTHSNVFAFDISIHIQQQPPEKWILSRNLNWQKFGCDPKILGYHQQRWNINPWKTGNLTNKTLEGWVTIKKWEFKDAEAARHNGDVNEQMAIIHCGLPHKLHCQPPILVDNADISQQKWTEPYVWDPAKEMFMINKTKSPTHNQLDFVHYWKHVKVTHSSPTILLSHVIYPITISYFVSQWLLHTHLLCG